MGRLSLNKKCADPVGAKVPYNVLRARNRTFEGLDAALNAGLDSNAFGWLKQQDDDPDLDHDEKPDPDVLTHEKISDGFQSEECSGPK